MRQKQKNQPPPYSRAAQQTARNIVARPKMRQAGKQTESPARSFIFPILTGEKPREAAPLILETPPKRDYALIDSGFGRKLERYGPYHIIRPEGQALWPPNLPEREWAKADAVFTGNLDEEGIGRWQFPQAEKNSGSGASLAETWPLQWEGLPFLGRFTSFRHVGVFPEQAVHWLFMEQLIKQAVNKTHGRVRVLNLFGYTGLASLIAARAGAEVTHIDASKKAIGWAQENQLSAKMENAPIRWICEDALKFMIREEKRRRFYDIILLDPPAYGRGPKGEIWQFFSHIAELTARARALLSSEPLAVILTAYSIRASFYALHTLMRESFRGCGGIVESGELILREEARRSEAPTGTQENLARRSEAPTGTQENLARRSEAPTGTQENLARRSEAPTGKQKNLARRSEAPTGKQKNLARRSEAPTGTQKNLARRSEAPTGTQKNLARRSEAPTKSSQGACEAGKQKNSAESAEGAAGILGNPAKGKAGGRALSTSLFSRWVNRE